MKKICTLFFVLVLLSFSITGDYPDAKAFDDTVPHIIERNSNYSLYCPPQLINDATNRGDYSIWLEDGTGNYFTRPADKMILAGNNNMLYDPFMLASVLYETPKRPPGTSARLKSNTPVLAAANECDQLTGNMRIKLFQNVRHVVGGDPMVLAFSYKIGDGKSNYRVLLKYNDAKSPVLPIFIPFSDGNESIDIPDISEINNQRRINSNRIPMIRTHAQETASFYSSGGVFSPGDIFTASGLADNAKTATSAEWTGKQFNNVVAFSLKNDTNIHNIFLTCMPGSFPPLTSTDTPKVFVEAVLQREVLAGSKLPKQKEGAGLEKQPGTRPETEFERPAPVTTSKWEDVEVSRLEDQVSDSHDPNKVIVTPGCIKLPQKETSLHYHLEFQNTGMGDADTVIALFHAPRQMRPGSTIKNVQVTCRGKAVSSSKQPGSHWYEYTTDPSVPGSIIFRVRGDLNGAYVNNPVFNDSTMGTIDFDLDVVPEQDATQATDIKAWADFFFHSKKGNTDNDINDSIIKANNYPEAVIKYEQPVTTLTAITTYRATCTYYCDCENHCCRLAKWWWLLLLLAVLTVITIFGIRYLLRNRRRNLHVL